MLFRCLLSRTVTTMTRQQAVSYRSEALDALASINTNVLLIDLIHTHHVGEDELNGSWDDRYATHLSRCSRLVANLRPHPSMSVLLGDASHEFDRILVSKHTSGVAARDALLSVDGLIGPRTVGAGSQTLYGQHSAVLSKLPTFSGRSPALNLPLRRWSDCPFVHEASARPDSWEALESAAEPHMFAFNLLHIPDRSLYHAYVSHFAHFPEKYGMRIVEAAMLQPLESVVPSFDVMVLAYFPSSTCFIDAWSDPAFVRDAFPLRAPLLAGGFRHMWLRCADEESRP